MLLPYRIKIVLDVMCYIMIFFVVIWSLLMVGLAKMDVLVAVSYFTSCLVIDCPTNYVLSNLVIGCTTSYVR